MRWAMFTIIFLWTLAVPAFGEGLPQVLQPSAYSTSEAAVLTQRIADLEKALADYTLGCRRTFGPDGWSSRDFAAYSAGILVGKGYKTVLVSGPGWPDGVHTWGLVGLALDGKTAWVPVEACPEAGHAQRTLGTVPVTTAAGGMLQFDDRYLHPASTVDLPPNTPPVAKIRPPVSPITAGEQARLLALGSYDPDGEIVLYKWDFGDRRTEMYTTWVARHTFERAGRYTVALMVIDNRGKSSTTSFTLPIRSSEGEAAPSSSTGGCGCGK